MTDPTTASWIAVNDRLEQLACNVSRHITGCRCATFIDLHHIRLRSEKGNHDPDFLVTTCGAHHRAAHRGTLWISGRVSTGLTFEQADGTRYGGRVSPRAAEAHSDAFGALRGLGFGESETRRALAAVGHVPGGANDGFDELVRRALRSLTPKPVTSSGANVVREPAAPYLSSSARAASLRARAWAPVGRLPTWERLPGRETASRANIDRRRWAERGCRA